LSIDKITTPQLSTGKKKRSADINENDTHEAQIHANTPNSCLQLEPNNKHVIPFEKMG